MVPALRPYQLEALQSSKERYLAGVGRQLISLPTGTGKTVLFACLREHHGFCGRVLVLVHREELAEQAVDKFRRWSPESCVGIEMGRRTAGSADDVVVASVQSLAANGGCRLAAYDPDEFAVVICDEAHHSVAPSYLQVLDHFGLLSAADHHPLLLGVTATPVRSDQAGLGYVYDELVFDMQIWDAMEQGWLVDLKAFRVTTETNLDLVRTRYGDFAPQQLERAVNVRARNEAIVRAWREHGQDRQTIAFCVDVSHAQSLAASFRQAGVTAEAVWGNDPRRRQKIEAHRRREFAVLANCAVLTEGYDDWQIGCVIMARPTKSQQLYVQMIGRGLRPAESTGTDDAALSPCEKQDCLLLDIVDNTQRHRLVTAASLAGLPPDTDLGGTSALQHRASAIAQQGDGSFPLDSHFKLEEMALKAAEDPSTGLLWQCFGGNYAVVLSEKDCAVVWEAGPGHWNASARLRGTFFDRWGFHSVHEAAALASRWIEEVFCKKQRGPFRWGLP